MIRSRLPRAQNHPTSQQLFHQIDELVDNEEHAGEVQNHQGIEYSIWHLIGSVVTFRFGRLRDSGRTHHRRCRQRSSRSRQSTRDRFPTDRGHAFPDQTDFP